MRLNGCDWRYTCGTSYRCWAYCDHKEDAVASDLIIDLEGHRAAHEGLFGLARKLVHTNIFFIERFQKVKVFARGSRCCPVLNNCLAHTNHPIPNVRRCALGLCAYAY